MALIEFLNKKMGGSRSAEELRADLEAAKKREAELVAEAAKPIKTAAELELERQREEAAVLAAELRAVEAKERAEYAQEVRQRYAEAQAAFGAWLVAAFSTNGKLAEIEKEAAAHGVTLAGGAHWHELTLDGKLIAWLSSLPELPEGAQVLFDQITARDKERAAAAEKSQAVAYAQWEAGQAAFRARMEGMRELIIDVRDMTDEAKKAFYAELNATDISKLCHGCLAEGRVREATPYSFLSLFGMKTEKNACDAHRRQTAA